MNNKLNLLRSSLLGTLLFGASLLFAQPITTINAGNLTQFLDEMGSYFGDIMEVSEAQLTQFAGSFVVSGTSNSCPAPTPVQNGMDDTQVSFSWAPGSSANYRVGYLNLMTGTSAVAAVTGNNYTFNVPNGLYAFAFQKNCGTEKSNATIIIYDKVVGLTAFTDLSCKCKHSEIITGDLAGIQVIAYHEFDIWIQEETSETVINQMHFKKSCTDCEEYLYNPDCNNNGLDVLNNIFYYQDGEDNNLATICLTGNNFGLQLDLAEGVTAALGICKESKRGDQNATPVVQVHPSGPQQYRIEKSAEENAGSYPIILYNQSGQKLKQWTYEAAASQLVQEIDLNPYPAGMYYLQIGTLNGVVVEKLIRS